LTTRHFILDVNVIVDLWLNDRSAPTTIKLLARSTDPGIHFWLAAASLTTLDYVARCAFKRRGLPPEAVTQIVPELIETLLGEVNVLSHYGFEQRTVYQSAHDFEDAQIAAAARSLGGQLVCVVTEDQTFDTLGEILAKTPEQALNWLQEKSTPPSAIPFIDLAAQQTLIRPLLERNIETVLRHGQYIMGPEIKQLEERLADYVGVKHCITVSDGTKALLIAMMALDIGIGDEVITTPFTFIATGEMIALLGAKPVFVDIDPRTYNIDPNKIEAAITAKTKAIMPVSLYGQCADLDAINKIAANYNLPVIEDGAQSFGATYKGKQSCGLSTIGSTSFFPSKPLGAYGDGGALFTNDDHLAKVMSEIRLHGQDRRYHHPRIGINGRMDTLQAAILLAKLSLFPQEVAARAEIGANYTRLINRANTNNTIVTPYIEAHNTSVYAQYTLQTENRTALQEKLTKAGIPTAVHYPVPLNKQPALKTNEFALAISESLSKKVISLPMHPYLKNTEQMHIVHAILSSINLTSE
jgi:UDP-2-acetamido-2-deoxy-ribo-hexuluronate aminotransferase